MSENKSKTVEENNCQQENKALKGQLDQVETDMMELLHASILDVFYSSIDAIFLILDNSFVENNIAAKELFEFPSKKDIKGKNFESISAPIQEGGINTNERLQELLLDLKKNGSCYFDWICQKQTGKTFHATVTFTEIYLRGQSHIFAEIHDITRKKEAERKIREMNNKLVELSRQAGMSEVATGVLHNIGNVLNSVNISTETAIDKIKKSRAEDFFKTIELIKLEFPDFENFLIHQERGQLVQKYFTALFDSTKKEHEELLAELNNIRTNVDAIKNIVSLQQSLATKGGLIETVSLGEVIENALQVNAGSIIRHNIGIIKNYNEDKLYLIESDRLKILQVLINLISNAIHACSDFNEEGNKITLTIQEEEKQTNLIISDNGIGIQPHNMKSIFEYGFTTKNDGHGFGLHNAALAAKEIGGDISGHSDGAGRGATFTFSILPSLRK